MDSITSLPGCLLKSVPQAIPSVWLIPILFFDDKPLVLRGKLAQTVGISHLRFADARSAADSDDLALLHHVRVHFLYLDL